MTFEERIEALTQSSNLARHRLTQQRHILAAQTRANELMFAQIALRFADTRESVSPGSPAATRTASTGTSNASTTWNTDLSAVNACDHRLVKQGMRPWIVLILIPIAIVLILAAITVPKYNQVRMSGYEAATIQAVKTINAAEARYHERLGHYTASLSELNAHPLTRYNFILSMTPDGYALTALPVAYNRTGRRSFYSDQTNIIRNHWGPGPATTGSVEIR